ncbi:MAG: aminopeptidase [Gemmatimonadota bacterium]
MRHRRKLIVLVEVLTMALMSCSPTYVLRAGWEEARILADRREIQDVLEDPATPPEIRQKLSLVREVRVFAERRLGLDAGRSFRSFTATDKDTLVMVVSAAPEFELRWKTWWFPVVGRLPYKGFFNFEAAHREAETLAARGYDTYVRPSAAFSTLGWFPDPVLTPALRGDELSITETVIHEITHTTFFPRGQAQFNESFANFVGHRGTIEFYCDARGDTEPCGRAQDRWHDARVFADFFRSVREPLEELYASDSSETDMRRMKRQIIEESVARFEAHVTPDLLSGRYRHLDAGSIDNAWLLSRLLYYERLDDFEKLHARYGSLKRAVEALIEAPEADPWEALDRLLDGTPAGPTVGAPSARGQ